MKTLKFFLLCMVILCPTTLFSQETDYSVSSIPEVLKKNAKAVVRKNIIELNIKSPSDAAMSVSYAITVLNENGIDVCYFAEMYDKFIKVNNIKATIYDGNGKKIRRIPGDEIIDHSAISGFSIYEDNRVKFIDPRYRTYPFTFEYSYDVNFNGIFGLPDWSYFEDFNISVEYSSLKVVAPKSYTIRYFEKNISNPVSISENGDLVTYFWEIKNLPPIKDEPYNLPLNEYLPQVFLAPSDFNFAAYSGNLSSWNDFGKWINELNKDRNSLPEETVLKIKDLVKDIDNHYDKVKTIYTYLQNKTRYVSIQVGIGGWQPFEASVVDKMSYGDCKALTNYMRSLLEVVGIKSNYCLVMAGSDAPRLIKDFSSAQFNHAFLCVPLENDTVWLECTSQIMPFAYIGDFTDDRDVLLIDDDGGKIVHTKAYSAMENLTSTRVVVDLDKEGNAAAKVHTDFIGLAYEDIIGLLVRDDAEKKKQLYERIQIPNFEISAFSHEVIKDRLPVVKEDLNLLIRNCGTFMGDRMMLNLNLMNQITNAPKRVSDRKSDIFIRRSFMEIDTVVYRIPDGYTVNKTPAGIEIKSPFGEYRTSVQFNGKEIVYIRSFGMNKGSYPVADYEKLVSFFELMITADLNKIVLTRI